MDFKRIEPVLPLFLHAQILVSLSGKSIGRFPRRLRYTGRTHGTPHTDPNRKDP